MFSRRWMVLAVIAGSFFCGCDGPQPNAGKPEGLGDAQTGSQSVNVSVADAPAVQDSTRSKAELPRATALTTANFKRIRSTSTREEIVALFGTPRTAVTGAEVAEKLLGNPSWGVAYESEVAANGNPADLLAYLEDGRVLIVAVQRDTPSSEQPDASIVRAWMATRNGDTRTGTLTYETLMGDAGPLRYSKTTVAVPTNR